MSINNLPSGLGNPALMNQNLLVDPTQAGATGAVSPTVLMATPTDNFTTSQFTPSSGATLPAGGQGMLAILLQLMQMIVTMLSMFGFGGGASTLPSSTGQVPAGDPTSSSTGQVPAGNPPSPSADQMGGYTPSPTGYAPDQTGGYIPAPAPAGDETGGYTPAPAPAGDQTGGYTPAPSSNDQNGGYVPAPSPSDDQNGAPSPASCSPNGSSSENPPAADANPPAYTPSPAGAPAPSPSASYDTGSPTPSGQVPFYQPGDIITDQTTGQSYVVGADGSFYPVQYNPAPSPTPVSGNTTPTASGSPAPTASGSPSPTGSPTPTASGSPTPTAGSPTPTAGSPTPTAGSPTPTAGSPTPTAGSPTPTAGSPTPSSSGSPTASASASPYQDAGSALKNDGNNNGEFMNRVRKDLGYGGDWKDGLSVSDLNAFIQKGDGTQADIDAAKAVVKALPPNTNRISVGDLNAMTGDGPYTPTVPTPISGTPTPSATGTGSPTASASASATATATGSASPTATATASPTATATASPSATATASPTASATASPTATATATTTTYQDAGTALKNDGSNNGAFMTRVRQNLGYGGDYSAGLSVSDLNSFIQKNTGSASDITAAKAVVAALPKNTDRFTVADLNAMTGDGPVTSTVPSTGNPNASSNPAPLGIMHGGQYDGYLAYRPAGADPNDDTKIQYARPLGSEITGPNGEPAFDFGNGKQGYEAKDPQNPNNTIIQFMDPHDSANSQNGSNTDLKAKAQTDLNNSSNKDGDISTIINGHYSNFGAAVTSNQDGIIGAQDWYNFANTNDDPKMDALVQDPLERAKMRATAQTVVDRINNAKNMSLPDAIGVFKNNGTNQGLIESAPGNNEYEKMEAIATGRAPLSSVSDPAEREKIRQAAARIIYIPMTDDERQKYGGGNGNHLNDNKYGNANGGPTLFTFLDNGFSSNDHDGSFKISNFNRVAN